MYVPPMIRAIPLALLVTLAACGGGATSTAKPASPTTSVTQEVTAAPLSQRAQADRYLSAVAPANAAVGKFRSQVSAQTPQSQVASAAETLAVAYDAVDNVLARIPFTGSAATDIRTLIAADGALKGDLRSVSAQSAFSASAFSTALARDAGAASSAVALIRADLGLPPA